MLPASSCLPAADPSSDYQKTPCLEAAERAVKLVGVAVQSSYESIRSPKSPRTAETARGMRQWCVCCCVRVVMSGGRKERVAHTTFTVSVYIICLLLTLPSRQQNESTMTIKQYQFRAPIHSRVPPCWTLSISYYVQQDCWYVPVPPYTLSTSRLARSEIQPCWSSRIGQIHPTLYVVAP